MLIYCASDKGKQSSWKADVINLYTAVSDALFVARSLCFDLRENLIRPTTEILGVGLIKDKSD